MGCGTSKKRKEESEDKDKKETTESKEAKAEAAPVRQKSRDKGAVEGHLTPNKLPETEQPSIRLNINEDPGCLSCRAADPHKVHILDCTHAVCADCAKKQLTTLIKSKEDEVIYHCGICKAPKALSKHCEI